MTAKKISAVFLKKHLLAPLGLALMLLSLALTSHAQVGHPAKGSWSGFLAPGSEQQSRLRLLIDDDKGELSATINPGRNGVDASTATLDAANWQLLIEAELPEGKLTLDGTLSNLGSWTNRRFEGTYTLGDNNGEFQLILN